VLGAALLNERVTPALLAAFVISLMGIALVNWPTAWRVLAASVGDRPVSQQL
jgi:drug/metabolite transporter (DMT)-like permease